MIKETFWPLITLNKAVLQHPYPYPYPPKVECPREDTAICKEQIKNTSTYISYTATLWLERLSKSGNVDMEDHEQLLQ